MLAELTAVYSAVSKGENLAYNLVVRLVRKRAAKLVAHLVELRAVH
jgi:hypothetical protein